jgi:hypothetical protein
LVPSDSVSGDSDVADIIIYDVQPVAALTPLDEPWYLPSHKRVCVRLAYYGPHLMEFAGCCRDELSVGDPVLLILCSQCLNIQGLLTFHHQNFATSTCCSICQHPEDVNAIGLHGFIWLGRNDLVSGAPSASSVAHASTLDPRPHTHLLDIVHDEHCNRLHVSEVVPSTSSTSLPRADGSLAHPIGSDPSMASYDSTDSCSD